jgi:hypothetical protein
MADWFTPDGKRHRKAFSTAEQALAFEAKQKAASKKAKALRSQLKSSGPTKQRAARSLTTLGAVQSKRSSRPAAHLRGRKSASMK